MYFFRYGDFQGEGGSYAAYNIVDSIQAWVPTSTPSATAFRNIVRTQNVAALSGVRPASASGSNIQRMRALAIKVKRVGYMVGGPYAFWCSPTQWENTAEELEAKGHRDITMKEQFTGIEAIKIRTVLGTVPLMAGPSFPNTGAWLLARNAMKMYTAGAYPEVLSEDGQRILRLAAADTYEIRFNGINGMCVRAPGANGYTALAT